MCLNIISHGAVDIFLVQSFVANCQSNLSSQLMPSLNIPVDPVANMCNIFSTNCSTHLSSHCLSCVKTTYPAADMCQTSATNCQSYLSTYWRPCLSCISHSVTNMSDICNKMLQSPVVLAPVGHR